MKFNNNKIGLSANTKNAIIQVVAIILIIGIAVLLWFLLAPELLKVTQDYDVKGLISLITLFITLATVVVKVSKYIISFGYFPKQTISLTTSVQDEYVTITCNIANAGRKRIVPKTVFLIVESGIENDGVFTFPYRLKHEGKNKDCALGIKCKSKGGICPSDLRLPETVYGSYKDTYRRIVQMNHLSTTTILFVDPGEDFSEDVVFKLENGVYRATAVWTSKNADCVCCTKEFIVQK